MQVIGVTEDGKLVVNGVGMLYYQDGIPLSVLFDCFIKHNIQPSWYHLIDELRLNGMKHDRIMHLLSEQIFESYGKPYRDQVMPRIEQLPYTGDITIKA
jgi:hypothetical protein